MSTRQGPCMQTADCATSSLSRPHSTPNLLHYASDSVNETCGTYTLRDLPSLPCYAFAERTNGLSLAKLPPSCVDESHQRPIQRRSARVASWDPWSLKPSSRRRPSPVRTRSPTIPADSCSRVRDEGTTAKVVTAPTSQSPTPVVDPNDPHVALSAARSLLNVANPNANYANVPEANQSLPCDGTMLSSSTSNHIDGMRSSSEDHECGQRAAKALPFTCPTLSQPSSSPPAAGSATDTTTTARRISSRADHQGSSQLSTGSDRGTSGEGMQDGDRALDPEPQRSTSGSSSCRQVGAMKWADVRAASVRRPRSLRSHLRCPRPPSEEWETDDMCVEVRATAESPKPVGEHHAAHSYNRPQPCEDFDSELAVRVSRSRQTMDYAAWQRGRFSHLDIGKFTLWDALGLMDTVPRVSRDASGMSPKEASLLCARWCISEFPEYEWASLVGLVHDLGRLLSSPLFGSEPTWTVASESYPLGCAFSDAISGHAFLASCPDRRCAAYATHCGIYSHACGLDAVSFTWTASEYLTMVLLLNSVHLPFEAIFLLRFQNFDSAIYGGAYEHLYSPRDRETMPLLRRFAKVLRRVRAGVTPPTPTLSQASVRAQCDAAIARYLPSPTLRW